MADYPSTLAIDQSTTESWADDRLISRARSGAVKGRLLATVKKRVFKVVHRYLSASQKTSLETFYDTNRALSFNFTLLGHTYVVIFGDKDGIDFEPQTGGQWNVSLTLLEV
jgi:hypothetical protein